MSSNLVNSPEFKREYIWQTLRILVPCLHPFMWFLKLSVYFGMYDAVKSRIKEPNDSVKNLQADFWHFKTQNYKNLFTLKNNRFL